MDSGDGSRGDPYVMDGCHQNPNLSIPVVIEKTAGSTGFALEATVEGTAEATPEAHIGCSPGTHDRSRLFSRLGLIASKRIGRSAVELGLDFALPTFTRGAISR